MRAQTKLAILAIAALLPTLLIPALAGGETSSEVTYCCGGSGRSSVPRIQEPTKPRTEPDRAPGTTAGAVDPDADPEPPAEGDRPDAAIAESTDQEPADRPSPDPTRHGRRPETSDSRSIADNRPATKASGLPEASTVPGQVDQDDDGSSPILPILIAIAALAILSAGVAFYNEHFRSRRS